MRIAVHPTQNHKNYRSLGWGMSQWVKSLVCQHRTWLGPREPTQHPSGSTGLSPHCSCSETQDGAVKFLEPWGPVSSAFTVSKRPCLQEGRRQRLMAATVLWAPHMFCGTYTGASHKREKFQWWNVLCKGLCLESDSWVPFGLMFLASSPERSIKNHLCTGHQQMGPSGGSITVGIFSINYSGCMWGERLAGSVLHLCTSWKWSVEAWPNSHSLHTLYVLYCS